MQQDTLSMNKPLPVQQYIPQQTIQSYLDALLQDASSELLLAEQEPVAAVQAEAIAAVVEASPVEPQPKPAPAIERKAAEVSERILERRRSAPEVAVAPQPHIEPELEPEQIQSAQPAWREQEFEALLFDVGGLTLAVPLVSLGTIHALDTEITPLFGQPDWFLGILPTSGGNLKVLDTARWVMP